MGQRRKHMLQSSISQEVQPPADNQHIVRALGSRGGNIVEVQYPSGDTTLCIMPAKFNRKLWVRRGGFLMIEACQEAAEDSGSRVTGTICAVLYEDHIKQLKKHPGVWPAEFAAVPPRAAAAADGSEGPDVPKASSSGSESDGGDDDSDAAAAAAGDGGGSASQRGVQQAAADDGGGGGAGAGSSQAAGGGAGQPAGAAGAAVEDEEEEEESDDGLPPLEQIHNRRVVHHYVTDSDSDEDE